MNEVILKNIEGLAHLLIRAGQIADEAANAENVDQAVGTIMAIESHLNAARSAFNTIYALHRVPR